MTSSTSMNSTDLVSLFDICMNLDECISNINGSDDSKLIAQEKTKVDGLWKRFQNMRSTTQKSEEDKKRADFLVRRFEQVFLETDEPATSEEGAVQRIDHAAASAFKEGSESFLPGTEASPSSSLLHREDASLAPGNRELAQHISALQIISGLFAQNRESDALSLLLKLPKAIQREVYESLWIIRGRPMGENPIAHRNFGEVSFWGSEPRCLSTNEQKVSSLQYVIARYLVEIQLDKKIIELMNHIQNGSESRVASTFNTLPSCIQEKIYFGLWEASGRPSPDSSDPVLKRMAHPDFGKRALFGLEPCCGVSMKIKYNALQNVRSWLKSAISNQFSYLQTSVEKEVLNWRAIDRNRSMAGQEKNLAKKKSLRELAKNIVGLCGGDRIQEPTPETNPITRRPRESCEALTAAYVNQYPITRPFFSQLVPNLRLSPEEASEEVIDRQPSANQRYADLASTGADNSPFAGLDEHAKKLKRVKILEETLDISRKGFYYSPKTQHRLDLTPVSLAAASLKCIKQSGGSHQRLGRFRTKFFLDRQDCLFVAEDCAQRNLRPIVLNAANSNHFGGGYKNGAIAQEEDLTRRTDLAVAMDQTQGFQTSSYYPLHQQSPSAGLYVNRITVFRGTEGDGYRFLEKPFEIAVASMAAYNFRNPSPGKPPLLETDRAGELHIPAAYVDRTREKIRVVFQMAADHNHEALVLVPLGCGAFCNPPKDMCHIIMDTFTQEFPHSFKEVHVTILDDHNTKKIHNRQGNYAAFRDVIENKYLNELSQIGASFDKT